MGQPGALKVHHPSQDEKPTQGTETSKYLEEKKIIMIPQVVASEKGKAQTLAACCQRVVGLHLESNLK
jgi:hypothetical protein